MLRIPEPPPSIRVAVVKQQGFSCGTVSPVGAKNDDAEVERDKTPPINISLYSRNVHILNNEVAVFQGEEHGNSVIEVNITTTDPEEVHGMVYDTTDVRALLGKLPNRPADPYRPEIDVRPGGDDDDDPVNSEQPVAPEELTGDGIGAEVRLRSDMRELYNGGVEITDFDFAQDDDLVFAKLDNRSFLDYCGENRVDDFDRGSSVWIDSALDIQEIPVDSRNLEAYSSGSDLVIEIEQGRDGAEVTLVRLGAAFDAACICGTCSDAGTPRFFSGAHLALRRTS